jgi:hypothetical protein
MDFQDFSRFPGNRNLTGIFRDSTINPWEIRTPEIGKFTGKSECDPSLNCPRICNGPWHGFYIRNPTLVKNQFKNQYYPAAQYSLWISEA